jgi:type I restriction enzyme S subunit
MKNVPILLPPLPEQQAIAKVLSSFDDKIELLREENQTLEQMGQELFKEWFRGPLTP